MTRLRGRWPLLLLEASAGLWTVPAAWALATWLQVGAPLGALSLAFVLAAGLRRWSLTAATLGALLGAGLAALLAPASPNLAAAAFALLPAARGLALPHESLHWSLRAEFRRGLIAWVLVALLRSVFGVPPAWPLAWMAGAFLVASLAGLPLLHSRDALGDGPEALRRALPGLRVSALIGLVGSGLGLLIWLGGALLTPQRLAALGRLLFLLLGPVAYLLLRPLTPLVEALRHHQHPIHPRSTKAIPRPTAQNLHDLARNTHVLLLVGGALLVLAVLVASVLAARLRREANPPENRPQAPGDVRFEALSARREGHLDFGSGARRIVRTAVWRHLRRRHRGSVPPSTTARRLAREEGWPEEALHAYEQARYQMRQEFGESSARRFVRAFRIDRRRDPED